MSSYLSQRGIGRPRELSYDHCRDYVVWRTQNPKKSGRYIKKNTAILELKFLRVICAEAVRKGFITVNPAAGLRLKRDETPEKPALTDTEIELVRSQLVQKNCPQWMVRSFEIGLATGARQGETAILFENIDFERTVITYCSPKGGRARAFTAPIVTPYLVPLLLKWRKEGGRATLEVPPSSGRDWRRFFDSIGLHHICFHCTRVTFITRCCLAGTPESVCRRLVNHSSEEVHRVYQRLRPVDIQALANIPKIPSPS